MPPRLDAPRFITFDALRGLIIILVMMGHLKVQFLPLSRLATPGFIILFGAMIEIAYLSKIRAGVDMLTIRQRMAGCLRRG